MTSRRAWLTWIERALLVIGVTLAAWCVAVIVQARYFEQLPVPSAPAQRAPETSRLPGDPGSGNTNPAPTPVPTGAWVARLDAPSVQLSATVLEGSDDATLAKAAGHIEDTAMPGEPGNIGIAGHRDTTFRPVRHLKIGDALVLTTPRGSYEYRIRWTKVVDPEDVEVIDPTKRPSLTLVTCYPFEYIGHAPHRFIVRAELVKSLPSGTAGGNRGDTH